MASHPLPYHYEDIPVRTKDARFRVGDAVDDVVTSFPTEEEARQFVRDCNARWNPLSSRPNWRY